MLNVNISSFRYRDLKSDTLKDVSIKFRAGQIYSLQGSNGAGKTTLSLIIAGAIPQLIKGEIKGEIFWNNFSILGKIDPAIVSYAFQNPSSNFCGFTPRQELGIQIKNNQQNYLQKVLDIIQKLSIESLLDLPLSSLSVGQQQKVAIAAVLATSSHVKILDEPFEFLDNESCSAVASLIETMSNQNQVFIIIDRDHWKRPFQTEVYDLSNKTSTRLPPNWKPSPLQVERFSGSPGDILLRVEGMNFSHKGKTNFSLSNFSLHVRKGECLCLFGPNGSGKSTILYLLAGLIKSGSGKFLFKDNRIGIKGLRRFSKLSFQDPEAQIFLGSVQDELLFGLKFSDIPKTDHADRLNLAKSILPFDLNSDPFSLSYGQKKLLTTVASLIMRSTVLLLDEPTAGLDENNIHHLSSALASHLSAGGAIIMSSHDIAFVENFCHRVILLKDGRQIDELSPQEITRLATLKI